MKKNQNMNFQVCSAVSPTFPRLHLRFPDFSRFFLSFSINNPFSRTLYDPYVIKCLKPKTCVNTFFISNLAGPISDDERSGRFERTQLSVFITLFITFTI